MSVPTLPITIRPLRLEDIEAFRLYAISKLESQDNKISFAQCVKQFIDDTFREEDLEAIREGLAQAEAGLCTPFEEVDRRIREKLGFPLKDEMR
ncbi:hypothetical protein [Lacunimicrobium album]